MSDQVRDDEVRLAVEDSVDIIFCKYEDDPVQGSHEVVGGDMRHVGRQDGAVDARAARADVVTGLAPEADVTLARTCIRRQSLRT